MTDPPGSNLHCNNYSALSINVTFFMIILYAAIKISHGANVKPQTEKYQPDYRYYHNLTRAIADATDLIKRYGSFLFRDDEYQSRSGKSQVNFRVFNSSQEPNKLRSRILLAYGEHAREFFPIESMFYFMRNLTAGLDTEQEGRPGRSFSQWVLNNFDIYVIGLANPDGKDFIEKSKNYCWRGTGTGVDINRNFDWNYGGNGSSKDPQDDEYRGPYAFSEPETNVFQYLAETVKFDAFVSFHSGVRHIYIPYADSKSKQLHRIPENQHHMVNLAKRMVNASPSRQFEMGMAYELNGYVADGTSFDYMAGVAKVPFSFAIEMWGAKDHVGSSCFDEFNPPSEELEEELALVHPLYVELLLYLFQWKSEQNKVEVSENRNAEFILHRTKKDYETDNKQEEEMLESTPQHPTSFSESHLMYALFSMVAALCVVLGARHVCFLMRKKRIVSLKSLSSTFSLFKS
ncbi:unnamed protein product [Lymnaea stagnalis]|uniref:Peptidase M14 domain-containing protein n=1 Tax=Lymnaea stagnalis TaxID=6523 RepID=A0AAV2HE35_LYMST